MMDMTLHMIELAKTLSGLSSRVYREYPSAVPTAPYCVIGLMSRSADLILAGAETVVSYTYTADIYADKQSSAEALGISLSSIYAAENIQCQGMNVGYSPDVDLHKASCTFRVVVDSRNTTYI